MINPFKEALPIIKKIEEAGYEAYFVGGAVRDYLLNIQINDIDIASSATPEEIKAIFPHTIDVGIAHGTVMVIWNQDTYEITTFRTESTYLDYRRPEQVFFVRELKEDLKRRDFTINAMAMDKNGQIIDYFNGEDALKKKEIKTVGNPNERFQEDALRMMRGIRFVSTLGFQVEMETLKGIVDNQQLLSKIAVERITAEFEKLLQGRWCSDALEIMIETKLYRFLPMLESAEKAISQLAKLHLTKLELPEKWAVLLLCLGVKDKQQIELFLRAWKLSVKQIKTVQKIIYWILQREQMSTWSRQALYFATLSIAVSAEKIYHLLWNQDICSDISSLEEQYRKLPIKSKEELAISGNDLLRWTEKRPGPWIKDVLSLVESKVVEQKLPNDKQLIKEWLQRCHQI
ncbi:MULTISPECIES: CCA tRNA nucleotidyltransferase [Niallia]|uniref:CCA-adding enzyme n=1 Tax=Niallia alba TaxID=2729105 RepID=A0A7Y0K9C0_9BACI|nr:MULTISPECIES: CCA tRNA nucleotidyltransferase [Niallia]MBQ6447312.1 CCA tRNA nucleotidyltransferase [Bacillus sp. (in: firmicutes)]NMO78231.1 CCA tRNA nucleotidyltransferase [Niallia alba]UTI41512.1 CCA tRNA nucleotidyltransferase [Niallia sp. RD1]